MLRLRCHEEVGVAMKHRTALLRFGAVRDLTGCSRSTVDRLEKQGRFPRRIRIGLNSVGWLEHEVQDWVNNRPRGFLPRS